MPPLDNRPLLACILKQLKPKLSTDPWYGLASLGIEQFGAIKRNMIELLHVKFPTFLVARGFHNIPKQI
jgi:hypothetical protein